MRTTPPSCSGARPVHERSSASRSWGSLRGGGSPWATAWTLLGPLLAVAAVALVLLVARSAWADGLETDLGDRLKQFLNRPDRSFGWAYILAFAAGLATSLTPCVYPLIPITVSLFGARDAQKNRLQSLGLAACYVGGLATMYTGLGVSVGLAGGQFGSFMTSPYFMVPVAIFFLLMAASMFGAFELALPSELQGRLSRVGGKGPLGGYLMGLVAGIIAAPCTGPPLAALLVFVSTQKSVFIGGSLLFVYALGMGVLFFAIAGFAMQMPKSGTWMDAVKTAFGVVMIVAALYFLRNVIAPLRAYGRAGASSYLLHAGIAATGILVGGLHLSFHDGPTKVARKLLGIVLLTFGLFGIVATSLAVPTPVAGGTQGPQLTWLSDEPQALLRAQTEHKPLLIDFGADWCLPCKQMELKTFSDPAVRTELGRFVLQRIDCTEETEANKALMKKYDSDTLPSVLVFDSAMKKVLTISEFTPPDKLLPVLQQTR